MSSTDWDIAMAFILQNESHPFENHQNSIYLFYGQFLFNLKDQ